MSGSKINTLTMGDVNISEGLTGARRGILLFNLRRSWIFLRFRFVSSMVFEILSAVVSMSIGIGLAAVPAVERGCEGVLLTFSATGFELDPAAVRPCNSLFAGAAAVAVAGLTGGSSRGRFA